MTISDNFSSHSRRRMAEKATANYQKELYDGLADYFCYTVA
jgi:hypothetical protein